MTGLDTPAKKEIAMQIVSSNENSSTDWRRVQYPYIEDIGDGRGYTGGIVGFTSATGDMLDLVEHYRSIKPVDNLLARYIPALAALVELDSDSHEGLDPTFKPDWETAAADPLCRTAQDDERDRVYFGPAVSQGSSDGLGTLGQFIYYDAIVMHGAGDFPGFDGIRDKALEQAQTPAQGGDEATYLNAFLDARLQAMDEDGHGENKDRVETEQRGWVGENLHLDPPLSWVVNGLPFEINGSVGIDSGAAAQAPAAGLTPGELLDIGASRQNHYAVQVAPTGAAEFVTHSQAEIEEGYSDDPYFVVTPSGTGV